MAKVFNSLAELVGNTPLLRLRRLEKEVETRQNIIVKLEGFNPYSVKDRVAKQMLEDAERDGLIENGVVVEPTSGNTGIGLAFLCAIKGYRLVLTMPETMSVERRKLLALLGAEIVLTEGAQGMNGAIKKAEELTKELAAFMPSQFSNPSNPKAHKKTAEEIVESLGGAPNYFVAGVGSGGTLTGVARELRPLNTKIIAVEPLNSAVISGGKPAAHKLQGIGAGFIPKNCDVSVIDEVAKISDDDAFNMVYKLGKLEGLLLGISGGAAIVAAVNKAKQLDKDGKTNNTIVVIAADSGERYLSTL